jgi:hypothetical protein
VGSTAMRRGPASIDACSLGSDVVTMGMPQFPFVHCIRMLQFCCRLLAGSTRRFIGSIVCMAAVGEVCAICQPTNMVPVRLDMRDRHGGTRGP